MAEVYNIIEDSVFYQDKKGLRFYFSSEFNKKRFKKGVDLFIKTENRKVENRYKVRIDLDQFMAITFYKRIEKRGFRVFDLDNKYYLTGQTQFFARL